MSKCLKIHFPSHITIDSILITIQIYETFPSVPKQTHTHTKTHIYWWIFYWCSDQVIVCWTARGNEDFGSLTGETRNEEGGWGWMGHFSNKIKCHSKEMDLLYKWHVTYVMILFRSDFNSNQTPFFVLCAFLSSWKTSKGSLAMH